MDTFADKMARHWAGIERAMKLANRNPAFRPQVESLINIYFDLIDEMAAELEHHAPSTPTTARLAPMPNSMRQLPR
jgi:hypothetical protein